ncbi:MAG TPA: hypothetical protein VFS54_06725 [Solirubrobacterales bacterium]|nr:hypothetical protein [Solirubrobacterales bacterium]
MLSGGLDMGSQETFFQIAATLIPILIFSGVVAERGGPRPRDSYRRILLFAVGIPVFGTLAVLAEMVSISSLVIGSRGGLWVGFVAMTLAVGLVGVVVSVWLPWLADLQRKLPDVYRSLRGYGIVLLAVVLVGTAASIYQSVESANDLEREEARARAFRHASGIQNRKIRRVEEELDGKTRQKERLRVQERVDTRTAAEASERLARAKAEGASPAVLKILQARVKYEAQVFKGDLEMDSRLDKEIAQLFKKWDKHLETLARLRP